MMMMMMMISAVLVSFRFLRKAPGSNGIHLQLLPEQSRLKQRSSSASRCCQVGRPVNCLLCAAHCSKDKAAGMSTKGA